MPIGGRWCVMLRKLLLFTLIGIVVLALLSACGGGTIGPGDDWGPDPTPTDGVISGTVSVGPSSPLSTANGLTLDGKLERMPKAMPASEFVTGQLVVGFEDGLQPQASSSLAVAGELLQQVGSVPALGVSLFENPQLDRARTLSLAVQVEERADVAYAHPNYILRASAQPNDPFVLDQWHYASIGMAAAWDITTGSPSVVVAVVDSGILHSFTTPALTHPELVGKVLPGYDFISDSRSAGDGDGRDPDPYDSVGSFHGTHVAGTIGASTNNGQAVAGIDWHASLLPVRVLGDGGTVFDIVEGVLWAAGLDVTDVPDNPNPAHVINLSLAGTTPCTELEQAAYDLIAASAPRDAVVVAAAGNENTDVALTTPASCRNVITVGATDYIDHRAPYSNFGTRIDVMAPGGDTSVDRNGDGYSDGVLSPYADADGFGYYFLQGTSMAAPHVAGVVSLMKSLNPGLTRQEALSSLVATATPRSARVCGRPSGAECGAGLIDAAAALALVYGGNIPEPEVGELAFGPSFLDFGTYEGALTVTLRNRGSSPVAWEAPTFRVAPENPSELPDYTVVLSNLSGTVPAGGTSTLDVEIDRSLVPVQGSYGFAIALEASGQEVLLYGSFVVADTTGPTLQGPMIVAAFIEDATGELATSGFEERDTFFSDYSFIALPGSNWVAAWSDENDNYEIDEGDFLGVYQDVVQLAGGAMVSGVNFGIERVLELDAAGIPAGQEAARELRELLEDARRPR